MKQSVYGTGFVVLAVLLWSSSFVGTKLGLEEIPPAFFAFLRSFFAVISLILLVFLRKKYSELIRIFKQDFVGVILSALTGVFLLNVLQNYGMQKTSSAIASVLVNSSPLFIVFLAAVFLREKLNFKKIFGVLMGLVGMFLIVIYGESLSGLIHSGTFIGNLLVLGVAASWAVYSILNKKMIKERYDPLILTLAAYILGAFMLFPTAIFFENYRELFELSLKSWFIVIYLGVFVSAFALLTWNLALSKMDVSKAAIYLYFIPVIAIFIGVFFLKEDFSLQRIIGTLLILGGVYVSDNG